MPWSFDRMYDATYEQAMREIDTRVASLRAQGMTQIVVIGHSLAPNAASVTPSRMAPCGGRRDRAGSCSLRPTTCGNATHDRADRRRRS